MSRSAPQVSKSAPSGRRAGPESVGTATRKTEAGEAQGNVCFRCREQGHRAYECPQRQNDVRLNHMIEGDEDYVEEEEQEEQAPVYDTYGDEEEGDRVEADEIGEALVLH